MEIEEAGRQFLRLPFDSPEAHAAIRTVRQHLAMEGVAGAGAIRACLSIPGLVDRCIAACQQDPATVRPELQYETLWVLLNIASGDSEATATLLRAGVVPAFLAHVRGARDDLRESAIWGLGNIAGDGAVPRNVVIEAGAIDAVLDMVVRPALAPGSTLQVTAVRLAAWMMANVMKFTPAPELALVQHAAAPLSQLLLYRDGEVIQEALFALAHMCDGPTARIGPVVDTGCMPRVCVLAAVCAGAIRAGAGDAEDVDPALADGEHGRGVLRAAIRLLGNVASGTDAQTELVVRSAGGLGLRALVAALAHTTTSVVQEAAFALSNIAAGNPGQIQALADADAIPPLILVAHRGPPPARNEAAFALANLCDTAPARVLAQLLRRGGALVLATAAGSEMRSAAGARDAIASIFRRVEEASQEVARGGDWGGLPLAEVQPMLRAARSARLRAQMRLVGLPAAEEFDSGDSTAFSGDDLGEAPAGPAPRRRNNRRGLRGREIREARGGAGGVAQPLVAHAPRATRNADGPRPAAPPPPPPPPAAEEADEGSGDNDSVRIEAY